MNNIKWLYTQLHKSVFKVCILVVVQALLSLSSIAYAFLLRMIVNGAVDRDSDAFYRGLIWFGLVIVAQLLLRAIIRYLEELTRAECENQLKGRLFDQIMGRDYARITGVHSGEWMNRLTSDTVVVAEGVAGIVPGLIGMLVKIIGAMCAIVYLEPAFLYIIVPGGLFISAIAYCFRKVLKRLHKYIQEADGRLRIYLQEHIESLMIIKAFGMEDNSRDQAQTLMEEHKAARIRRNHVSNICNSGFGAAMNGFYALGVAFCGYGILMGTMTYGNMMAMMQLVSQLQTPFANISGLVPRLFATLASAERLRLAEDYERDTREEKYDRETCINMYRERFAALKLDNVSYSYLPREGQGNQDMPIVLTDFDLTVHKGDYVAFTGPSGCGKSTVMKLILGLYEPGSGQRLIEYTDGSSEVLDGRMRNLFSYVPQGNQLLSGSIRSILCFGDERAMADETGLKQALKIACADDFVDELADGLDTVLGERGLGLSEGQMQRIALARAVYSGRPIMLLDEATSSLDEATEARLLDNLRTLTDKTVIIVTHRKAVLNICDRVVEFDGADRDDNIYVKS